MIPSKNEMFRSTACACLHKSKTPREPLMLFSELADEFGVTFEHLRSMFAARGGPKPAIDKGRQSFKRAYYRPSEVRKWWAGIGSK